MKAATTMATLGREERKPPEGIEPTIATQAAHLAREGGGGGPRGVERAGVRAAGGGEADARERDGVARPGLDRGTRSRTEGERDDAVRLGGDGDLRLDGGGIPLADRGLHRGVRGDRPGGARRLPQVVPVDREGGPHPGVEPRVGLGPLRGVADPDDECRDDHHRHDDDQHEEQRQAEAKAHDVRLDRFRGVVGRGPSPRSGLVQRSYP